MTTKINDIKNHCCIVNRKTVEKTEIMWKRWSSDLIILIILDQFEESDESSSSADPSAAVDQQGSVRHLDQIVLSLVLQVQQHLRVSRHLQVGPAFAVELGDEFHFSCIS